MRRIVFEDGSVEDVATGKVFIEATEHRGTATGIFTADVDFSCGLRNTDDDDDDDDVDDNADDVVVVRRDDLRLEDEEDDNDDKVDLL